ncbi:hypothetical protein Golax_010673 [Gossypium laxum]|uniref:Uncharacterized protein n=1 Tax=Gossypium laxum TaxID=34288 RepID=A0A7J8ZI82_9ROSI|nr:hypothetical protein [Gossypium laxum]
MPPRKKKRTLVEEAPHVSHPIRFHNANMKKYFLESQGGPLIQEQGNSMRPLRTK